jgi:hypothetical protein
MQATLLAHATDCSCRDVATRFGVASAAQADPFQASAIDTPMRVAPTAVQTDEDVQLTPASAASAKPALGCRVHAVPFHDSAIAVRALAAPVDHPTALHDAGPAHDTASRKLAGAPAGRSID